MCLCYFILNCLAKGYDKVIVRHALLFTHPTTLLGVLLLGTQVVAWLAKTVKSFSIVLELLSMCLACNSRESNKGWRRLQIVSNFNSDQSNQASLTSTAYENDFGIYLLSKKHIAAILISVSFV